MREQTRPLLTSHEFVVGSEVTEALRSLREQAEGHRLSHHLTLQRRVGRGPWQRVMSGTQREVREFVRGYDGSPLPGRWRLLAG